MDRKVGVGKFIYPTLTRGTDFRADFDVRQTVAICVNMEFWSIEQIVSDVTTGSPFEGQELKF